MVLLAGGSAVPICGAAIAALWLCGCALPPFQSVSGGASSDSGEAGLDGAVDGAADGGTDGGEDPLCDGGSCDAGPDAAAACEPKLRLIDDFESGTLGDAWEISSEAPWRVSDTPPTLGTFSASGDPTDEAASDLRLELSDTPGGAILRFDLRVTDYWDNNLSLWINDVLLEEWSGDHAWQRYESPPLLPGRNRVAFRHFISHIWMKSDTRASIDNVMLVEPCSAADAE